MSSDQGHRSMMNSNYLAEPAEIGGAFEGHGADMHGSFVTTIGPDPRTEDDLFIPSSSHIGQSYAPNLSPVDMARAHSGHHSMQSAVYSTGDRAPTRPLFAVQGHDNGVESQPQNGHVISIPAGYRERPAPPASLTGSSSISRDASQRSHRSSVGSQGYPQTPISEYDVPFSGLSMSTSPQFPNFQHGARGYQLQASYSPPESSFTQIAQASQMAPPMARNNSSRSQKEKKFHCDILNCPHGRPFGTRNDLDRHKLAVHKIAPPHNATLKVYVCQGGSCLSQGKNKIWPRKDNFKNHCKVAHQEVDADTLITRSERLASTLAAHELESFVAEENHGGLQVTIPTNTATHNGIPPVNPQVRVSLSPISRRPSDAECHPCQSPGYLSPHEGGSRRNSFSRQSPELQGSGSSSSSITVRQNSHRRSSSNPNAPGMSRGACDPSVRLHPSSSDSKISSSDLANLRSFLKPGAPDHIAQLLRHLAETNRGIKRQREGADGNGDRRHKCEHASCNKTFRRACDLKKHMTRHTKPWGCTDPSCNKHFGSKNDWKRHELSRHYQRGAWICGQPPLVRNTIGRCTENFPSAKEFRDHLKDSHGIDQEIKVKELVKNRHIGRNWAVAVWCGFCKEIIFLTRENQDAWNERFDHIDSHLNGTFEATPKQLAMYSHLDKLKGHTFEISQWIPPNTDKTKGELGDSMSESATLGSGRCDQVGDDDDDEEDDDDEALEDTSENLDSGTLGLNTALGINQDFDQDFDTTSPAKRRKVTRCIWNCYDCGMGLLDWNFQDHCGNCGAAKTANVNKETHTEWVDDYE